MKESEAMSMLFYLMDDMPLDEAEAFLNRMHDNCCVLCSRRPGAFECFCWR